MATTDRVYLIEWLIRHRGLVTLGGLLPRSAISIS